jgi:hypothetical protein
MPPPRSSVLSPATTALGFAQGPGDQLTQQVDDELEDQKRRKLLGAGSSSPSVQALFGVGAASGMGMGL